MTNYYKIVQDGFIVVVGTGTPKGSTEITEEEYVRILSVVSNKPTPQEGKEYMLKDDMTWVEYTITPVKNEPTAEDILSILTGETE